MNQYKLDTDIISILYRLINNSYYCCIIDFVELYLFRSAHIFVPFPNFVLLACPPVCHRFPVNLIWELSSRPQEALT